MISAIVAVDNNWGIGYNGDLLEKIPEDMKRFKELTTNKVVIMGRKTWDSLPQKPLPDRYNVIITNNCYSYDYDSDDYDYYTMEEAIDFINEKVKSGYCISGGG